jgi:hypothetical protein
MSQTPSKPGYPQLLLGQLRHPLKLRLVLFAAVMGGWYALFFGPLSARMAVTTSAVDAERKRVATAREVAKKKKALAPYRGRVLATADVNTLIRQVIERLRPSPLKLVDLKPEKSRDLGPYETVGLRLTLEGRFADIDQFLGWVESNPMLLRNDSIKLDPAHQEPGRLTAQLVVLVLAEKPADAAKSRPAAGKR